MVSFVENPEERETGYPVESGSSVTRALRAMLQDQEAFPAGTIIAWDSVTPNHRYRYAAIYGGGRWYTTLATDNSKLKRVESTEGLMAYFAKNREDQGNHVENLRVAVEFEAL